MTKKRLKELDIMRALAFIFVVTQHIIGGYSYIEKVPKNERLILKMLYIVAKPAVPIFLTISAISLFYVYYDNFHWKKYYIKRVKYILFMLFTILAVYILALYLANFKKLYNKLKFIGDYSFAAYMSHIIVLNWVANYLQLWFGIKDYLILGLCVLAITSIITPLIICFLSYFPYSQYVTGVRNNMMKSMNKSSSVMVYDNYGISNTP